MVSSDGVALELCRWLIPRPPRRREHGGGLRRVAWFGRDFRASGASA